MKKNTIATFLMFFSVLTVSAIAAELPSANDVVIRAALVSGKPTVADFGARTCIPCKKMAPILEALKKDYAGKLEVEFIDVWKSENEAKKYGINLIPTQIFFDATGKELFRHEGFYGRDDILAKWKELGVKLDTGK